MKLTAKGVKWLKSFGLNDKQIKKIEVGEGYNNIYFRTMNWCCGGAEMELAHISNKAQVLRTLLRMNAGVVVATGTQYQQEQINILKSCGFSCSRKAINPNTGNALYILTRTIPQGLLSNSW